MLSSNVKEEKDFNPWPGLTLACVRILELYAKVFEQDLQLIARYLIDLFVFFFRISAYFRLIRVKNRMIILFDCLQIVSSCQGKTFKEE